VDHRTKILGNQIGRDDVAMVAAFALYLTYLVCQLCGVAHGSGKKRKLLNDDDAQTALMVRLTSPQVIEHTLMDDV
jgi:hypothetical protein